MSLPEVKAQMIIGGSEAVSSTPAQIIAKLAEADARARKLYKAIGLTN